MGGFLERVHRMYRNNGLRSVFLLLTELERRVSARLTGVPAGFLEQLHGNSVRYGLRIVAPAPSEMSARGSAIRSQGVEALGPVVDEGVVDRLLAVFDERVVARDPSVKVTSVDGRPVSEAIEFKFGDPALPLVQEVMVAPLVDSFRATLGTNFHVVSYTMWRNHPLPEGDRKDIYSNRWHVDGARTDEFKAFVFMHETTENHGGTIIATRSETRAACRAGYSSRNAYAGASDIFSSLDHKSCMTGPKGFAYIFSPNLCLHRAGIPKQGLTRTVLMVRVLPARRMDLSPRRDDQVSTVSRAVKKLTTFIGHNDP